MITLLVFNQALQFKASYTKSSFDVVLCGVVPPPSFVHGDDLLEELGRILKPSGSLVITEPVFKDS